MITKLKKHSWPVITLLSVLILWVGIGTFIRNLNELRNEVESTFKSRAELIRKFVDLQRERVHVMTSLMIKNYDAKYSDNSISLEIHEYP